MAEDAQESHEAGQDWQDWQAASAEYRSGIEKRAKDTLNPEQYQRIKSAEEQAGLAFLRLGAQTAEEGGDTDDVVNAVSRLSDVLYARVSSVNLSTDQVPIALKGASALLAIEKTPEAKKDAQELVEALQKRYGLGEKG